jgi:hypothetical protein
MFSIIRKFPDFAACCEALQDGQTAYSFRAEIPFDIHCYRDGWHVYWKNPPNGIIGRKLRSMRTLQVFLNGDWGVGMVLRCPDSTQLR